MEYFRDNVKIPGISFDIYDRGKKGHCKLPRGICWMTEDSFEIMANKLVKYYDSIPEVEHLNDELGERDLYKSDIRLILFQVEYICRDRDSGKKEKIVGFYFME